MHVTAIIVAAGEGKRLGGQVSKSFFPIAGRPLVLRTLDRFFSTQSIEKVILVVAEKELRPSQALIQNDPNLSHRPWVLQVGGATRQESVRRGLEKLDTDCEIVAIHDGARPFVSSSLIDRCVDEAHRVGSVVIGVPVRDQSRLGRALGSSNTGQKYFMGHTNAPGLSQRNHRGSSRLWGAASDRGDR